MNTRRDRRRLALTVFRFYSTNVTMIPTLPRVRPQIRRSAVVAAAVILAGLALSSLRADRQVVQVTTPAGTRSFHMPVDAPELGTLRKTLARQAMAHRVRKPDAYYRAAWRLQAATYYLQRSEQEAEKQAASATGDSQATGAVIQAGFQMRATNQEAAANEVAYWRQQQSQAERQFEAIAARLPSGENTTRAAGDRAAQPRVTFGPVVAAASTPAEALGLLLLGLAAGWGYYRASQPRPAAILLQTNRRVVVDSRWLDDDRGRRQQTLKCIDQAAWVCAVIALVAWAM